MASLPPLDPASTALVLIDLQKGITASPTVPLPAGQVIANARRLVDVFHERKAQVFLVHVTYAPDAGDRLRPEADEQMPSAGAVPKDWADFVPEMTPAPEDFVITKRQWGAFYGTDLDLELRRRGIKTLVLGGISTNYGVESTARDAYERAYQLIFAVDAMATRVAADHEFAVTRILRRIGRVRSTEEIVAALGGSPGRG